MLLLFRVLCKLPPRAGLNPRARLAPSCFWPGAAFEVRLHVRRQKGKREGRKGRFGVAGARSMSRGANQQLGTHCPGPGACRINTAALPTGTDMCSPSGKLKTDFAPANQHRPVAEPPHRLFSNSRLRRRSRTTTLTATTATSSRVVILSGSTSRTPPPTQRDTCDRNSVRSPIAPALLRRAQPAARDRSPVPSPRPFRPTTAL